jgi:arylsulfatase A-like enzyme
MTVRLALLLVLICSFASAAQKRPNVLFIYSDDQPYKTISCYPEAPKWVKTPNIDALAATGVRFHRSYLGAWCMPSRAAMLTGNLQHAVQSMRMEGAYPASAYDPAQCPFWPAELRKSGYHTAHIGKWHTGVDAGFGRDWDYQIVWNRPAHPENAGAYYEGQILGFNGVDKLTDGYSTDNYTNWAVDYIQGKNRDKDKPWYLWLCYGAIHGPTTPAARHKGTLKGNHTEPPADIFGPRPDKPAYLDKTQAWVPGKDGQPLKGKGKKTKNNFDNQETGLTYDKWVQQVNECNRAVDEGVGRVIQALKDSGQFDNTLVIYSADQGFALGEHGCSIKVAPYDANIASPLIISMPSQLPQGKVCKQPVNSPDLVSTIWAWTVLKQPWATPGHDMTPLLKDPETAPWDHPTMLVHTGDFYGSNTRPIPTDMKVLTAQGNVPWWVLLREGRFKYIRTLVAGEMEELYDLDADPEELHNLARVPGHAAQVESLRAKAIAELKRTGAPYADVMPAVMPLPQ